MEWLKLQGLKIYAIIITALLIGVAIGKGVTINNSSTSNSKSDSYSSSYSGSMSIGYIGGDTHGKWEVKTEYFNKEDWLSNRTDVAVFLNNLDPIQMLMSKVVTDRDMLNFIVYYPVITELKDKKITKGAPVVETATIQIQKAKTLSELVDAMQNQTRTFLKEIK